MAGDDKELRDFLEAKYGPDKEGEKPVVAQGKVDSDKKAPIWLLILMVFVFLSVLQAYKTENLSGEGFMLSMSFAAGVLFPFWIYRIVLLFIRRKNRGKMDNFFINFLIMLGLWLVASFIN